MIQTQELDKREEDGNVKGDYIMRVVQGSPAAQFIDSLPTDDPRRYGMPIGGFGAPQLGSPRTGGINNLTLSGLSGVNTSQLGSPRPGGINNLTLPGLSMNPPTQQATLSSPIMGGGFGQSQPMSNGFGQSQPMGGGGLKSLLDNYFSNFLTSYFQQNLR